MAKKAKRTVRKTAKKRTVSKTRKAVSKTAKPIKKKSARKIAPKITARRTARKKSPIKSFTETFPITNPRIIEQAVTHTGQDLAKDLKGFVNKHLSTIIEHPEYYEFAKKWTNTGIDMFIKLIREIEVAHKEYTLVAKDCMRRFISR